MRDPHSLHAFLELYIEQGPVLETESRPLGIVEGISLADFAHEISRILEEDGTQASRLTVGKVELKPGHLHTVPGEVDFSLVGRDMSEEVMRDLAHSCQKVLSSIARRHRLRFEYEELSWLEPRACHPAIIEAFENTARRLGIDPLHMPTSAGHDTQFMTEITRAGMIFVPSVGGVSHAPDEWTNWNDVEIGANVLLHTLLHFLDEEDSSDA